MSHRKSDLGIPCPRKICQSSASLVGRTCGQNYSHRCSWLIPAQPTHAEAAMPMSPVIEITYCRLCGWGLRAGWMAQELLTTFADELGSVTLTPDRTGGVFEVRVDDEVIWSRKERGRFPEIKEIKQLVRDRVAPGPSRGHRDPPQPQGVAAAPGGLSPPPPPDHSVRGLLPPRRAKMRLQVLMGVNARRSRARSVCTGALKERSMTP